MKTCFTASPGYLAAPWIASAPTSGLSHAHLLMAHMVEMSVVLREVCCARTLADGKLKSIKVQQLKYKWANVFWAHVSGEICRQDLQGTIWYGNTVFDTPPWVSMESSWSPHSSHGVLIESTDSSWSPCGVFVESMRTLWELYEDSMRTLWGLIYLIKFTL
jgi:hypothetical protein